MQNKTKKETYINKYYSLNEINNNIEQIQTKRNIYI